jgi:hypothetical protein
MQDCLCMQIFSDGDYFVTLTYSAKNLPESPDKGKKRYRTGFLRSLRN